MIFRAIEKVLKWMVRRFYGVEIAGEENLPGTGSALLVSNHVSYVDGVILASIAKRRVHFLMWRELLSVPVLGFFARKFGAMPVSTSDGPHAMRKSLDAAVKLLKQGHILCLFPEGAMTRTAHVQPFKRGFELIARRAGTRIIPVHLDGLWGSIFSYKQGRYFFKVPKLFGRPVRVTIGEPLPPDTDRFTVRRKIMELEVEAYAARKARQRPLHVAFMRNARRAWWWECMACSSGARLTWGGVLARSLAIARRIGAQCREERMVGVMLPASAQAALVNIALLMVGKAPVNLNYTDSHETVDEIIRRCRIRTVFTSKDILRHFRFPERDAFVDTAAFLRAVSLLRVAFEYVRAYVTPAFLAERLLMRRGGMNNLAAVMFTKGATGKPKGVMLTHHNIATNIEQVTDALRIDWRDMIMGVLPPFHAFGFTATLWLPLVSRIRVAYHANPLDARGVGRRVRRHRASILIGTPSFFAFYTRGCAKEDFASLRLVVAGGQKLQPAIAEAFERKFGKDLHEGYGCTEMSPVVAVNVPDVRLRRRWKQVTARSGSVGRPVPGLLVRVVDLKTYEPLPEGETGMVLVKGPNAMRAYMDDPHGTSLAIRKGWYYTRDIGMLDPDGFLHIHGRVTRFSKIAGETVQHAVVEQALAAADAGGGRRYAVVSLADPTRGQRLGVVYDGPVVEPRTVTAKLIHTDLPNLWMPDARDFTHVDALPMTADGEPDYDAVKAMVGVME